MAVSAKWQAAFAQMRAWAAEPGGLLFPIETKYGVAIIFPEEVFVDDDNLLALVELRAQGLPDSRDRAKESITLANWLDDWAPLPPWS